MNELLLSNGRLICFDLIRKNVKNINLRVSRDGAISVSAPRRVSVAEIEEFMISKTCFIERALNRFKTAEEKIALPEKMENGSEVRLFGRAYKLNIINSSRNEAVTADGEILLMSKNVENGVLLEKIIKKYSDEAVKCTVLNFCEKYYPLFAVYGIKYPEIKFRNMKSRWGSCQPKAGVLCFSLRLIEAPKEFIEYVVAHEYTHFLHADHSKCFYDALARFMPDWKARRNLMRNF